MKTSIILFSFLFLSAIHVSAQDTATCGVNEEILDSLELNIPFYLRPGFGSQITLPVVIVYVDFPDGRLNGTDQIFSYSQMLDLLNQSGGMIDAAAELGIDSLDGTRKFKPAKYTYFDRWEMFFSTGTYYGDVHPDYNVYGDLAYGSMKEYFFEATNGKVIIEPMITHPNATGDPRRMTGILNRDIVINGKHIIKSILLDRNKFGTGGYFQSPENPDFLSLKNDLLQKVDYLYNIGELDTNFTGFNGQIVVIIAGGSGSIGGEAYGGSGVSVNRGTTYHYTNNLNDPNNFKNRMDGFRIPVHEISHNPPINFVFHTNSGRYCAMNPNSSALHQDCPPHFNPAIKIQKGWIDPVFLETSMKIDNLEPMVASNSVGLITIYGKPSASPDNQTGEYFIVENRRLLGFDQKISDHENFDEYPNFKGGLLIWHYSPYRYIPGNIFTPGVTISNGNVKLLLPGQNVTTISENTASPQHFYGYYSDPISDPQYYNRDTNLTYSSVPLRTGIKIADIEQEQTTNSGISFELEYQISEPLEYDYVIYQRNDPVSVENLSGLVYFHAYDNNRYFEVNPGTIIETANFEMVFAGMKATGVLNDLIKFRGAGFENQFESHRFIYSDIRAGGQVYGTVDSLILKNIELENVAPNFGGGLDELVGDLIITAQSNVNVSMKNIISNQHSNYDEYNIVHKGGNIDRRDGEVQRY
jgi:hypothetical protein